MTDSVQTTLVSEVGDLIVEDPAFAERPWVSLALVASFRDGSREMIGYRYLDDGSFEAEVPEDFGAVMKKLRSLREAMRATAVDGRPWLQCLIQVVRPDLELKLAFEYDDPRRWAATVASRDMSAFADSLRPAARQEPALAIRSSSLADGKPD